MFVIYTHDKCSFSQNVVFANNVVLCGRSLAGQKITLFK